MKIKKEFKRVPALQKCFNVLDLLSKTPRNVGISEIANALGYHKGTVYNLAYTLMEMGVLEQTLDNKLRLGTRLYALGRAAGNNSELIRTVHPYLEEIHRELNVSAYLGVLIQDMVVTVDKVDSPMHLNVSSEIGLSTHILAGAVGKIILSRMADQEIEEIISQYKLKKYTPFSILNREAFLRAIRKVRQDGYAYSDQEYIEGIRAVAVSLNNYKRKLMTAIYVLGLNTQIKEEDVAFYANILKEKAKRIDDRLALT
ncbi:MAG: IclR family transcriptional regulator [Desulfatiglandales bacterium]